MKKIIYLLLFFTFCLSLSIFAQQKTRDNSVRGNALPSKDALLELESTHKGVLFPRVVLTHASDPSPLSRHVAGMMVYNTATNNDVAPGIYFNDGTRWVLAASGDVVNIDYDPVRMKLPMSTRMATSN